MPTLTRLSHEHKLIHLLVVVAEYVQHMDEDELASLASMVKKQRKKLKQLKDHVKDA